MLVLAVLGLVAAAAGVMYKMLKYAAFLESERDQPISVSLEDFSSLEPVAAPTIFGPATKSLTVVVPAYNEEDRLGATLEETINYLQQRRNRQGPQFTYEIIVVDDGSKDKTIRVAADFVKKHGFDAVRVLRVSQNRGKGHAVRRGMMVARGEFCLLMDADGATRVSDLEVLEASLAKNLMRTPKGLVGACFGSRAHLERAAMAKRSTVRNFLTRGFHFLVMFVAGSRIKDTQCGFKLFTRQAARLLFPNQRLQRWCFDVELLYLADQLLIPVSEVSVAWTEMPGSKIRVTSILHMAFELLTIKVAYQIAGLWKIYLEAELPSSK